MAETRTIVCEACGGDGAFEHPPAYPGEVIPMVTTCQACGGRGEVEVEVEPVERDDDLELLVEQEARLIAANKMGLVKDPQGSRLPDNLWRQCEAEARAVLSHIDGDRHG